MAAQGLKIKCPRCKKYLNVSTSESKSLVTVSARLVCCNPRCDGFRCNFLGEMVDFSLATFRPAPEIATWTKAEADVKNNDENQLELEITS